MEPLCVRKGPRWWLSPATSRKHPFVSGRSGRRTRQPVPPAHSVSRAWGKRLLPLLLVLSVRFAYAFHPPPARLVSQTGHLPALRWVDVPARALRRTFRLHLQHQQVSFTVLP